MGVEEVPFSELLSNVVDNRGKTCPTSDVGMPLIATNCIRNDLLYPAYEKIRYVSQETYDTWFRGHPKPGDLIFVTKGSPGRVCMAPDPVDFCIAQDMVAVRADPKKVYSEYLFALLRSPVVQARIEQMHVGTLIPHFKKGDFDKLLLPVPGRKTQRFIGDTYFELSARIELNRRMNKTLEATAQAIFKSWFVDFDPVQAKAAGEQPPGLTPHIADLFPDAFEESELGEIPEGWTVAGIYETADVIYGAPFSSAYFNDTGEGIPLIKNKDLKTHNPTTCTTEEHHPKATLINPGDLLVGMDAEFRMERWQGPRSYLNQRVCLFEPKPGIGTTFLSYSIVPSLSFFERAKTGTTVIHLGKRDIDTFEIVLPDRSVLQEFSDIAGPIFQRIVLNSEESRTLARLRDTLLPKLISGELRVPDVTERSTNERHYNTRA
jgi:type I restriction enzyme S subunit